VASSPSFARSAASIMSDGEQFHYPFIGSKECGAKEHEYHTGGAFLHFCGAIPLGIDVDMGLDSLTWVDLRNTEYPSERAPVATSHMSHVMTSCHIRAVDHSRSVLTHIVAILQQNTLSAVHTDQMETTGLAYGSDISTKKVTRRRVSDGSLGRSRSLFSDSQTSQSNSAKF
jgi:hypothetical protein